MHDQYKRAIEEAIRSVKQPSAVIKIWAPVGLGKAGFLGLELRKMRKPNNSTKEV